VKEGVAGLYVEEEKRGELVRYDLHAKGKTYFHCEKAAWKESRSRGPSMAAPIGERGVSFWIEKQMDCSLGEREASRQPGKKIL